MTNYEKIMQEMTLEKLAELQDCKWCHRVDENQCIGENCIENVKKWLEREAEK